MRLLCLALLAFTLPQQPQASEVIVHQKGSSESYERNVDEVALASQDQAISKLSNLLKKYRGTRQEAILLAKLADLQQQSGAINFRIAHGLSHSSHKAVDLSRYKKIMKASISTLNQLISKYPSYEEIAHSYFSRGKAYEEIGDKTLATRDYLWLVGRYPGLSETFSAYMSLAQFAIDENNHHKAIGYLKEIEKEPEDSHYPFALYKLAWAYYNLKDIPSALNYGQRHVAFYDARIKDGFSADKALRENTLLDITVFYFEGFEQGLPDYKTDSALEYFKKMETGAPLGRMILRYAKLLRSHSHENDLIKWKDQILVTESTRPEALEVLLTAYESQLNKNRFSQLIESAQDIVRLYIAQPQLEAFSKAQKLLLDTAELLQKLIIKNKGAQGLDTLSATLATIYDSFTKIVVESDPRVPRVHYNLAETLFEIKEYNQAASHYRWIVEKGRSDSLNLEDVGIKAIAARYEHLKQKGFIPSTLHAVARASTTQPELDLSLKEWIGWVDYHHKKFKKSKSRQTAQNFYFEANRALYGAGRITDAMERMIEFAEDYPSSIYAIPSATLALDTKIANGEWESLFDLAKDFTKTKGWPEKNFTEKTSAIAGDAFYKLIEKSYNSGDFKNVIESSDDFIEDYSTNSRLSDCLFLAGNAALKLSNKKNAVDYFSKMIAVAPESEHYHTALLARATIEEEKFDFLSALKDYQTYLSIDPKKTKIEDKTRTQLQEKVLALAWLSNNSTELRSALSEKSVCESIDEICDSYKALLMLQVPTDSDTLKRIVDSARKGHDKNRAIWAAVALKSPNELTYRERLHLLRQAAEHWEEADPLVRFTLLPHLAYSIPRALQINRISMKEVAPLRVDARYITARVDAVRELENTATKIAKLPWSRIRALALNEVAELYLDLSRSLQALPIPKTLPEEEAKIYQETIQKLVLPFEEKGQEIRGKALEIALKSNIDDEALNSIAEPFMKDNPSQAKGMREKLANRSSLVINFALLNAVTGEGDWKKLDKKSDNIGASIRANWALALETKNWAQVAFYLQEVNEKNLLDSGTIGLMKSVSLSAAGANAEGFSEFMDARGSFSDKYRERLAVIIKKGTAL